MVNDIIKYKFEASFFFRRYAWKLYNQYRQDRVEFDLDMDGVKTDSLR